MIICFPSDKSQNTNCLKLCFKWVELEKKKSQIAVGFSGVYSYKVILGGVCSMLLETLITLSETKIGDFPYPV